MAQIEFIQNGEKIKLGEALIIWDDVNKSHPSIVMLRPQGPLPESALATICLGPHCLVGGIFMPELADKFDKDQYKSNLNSIAKMKASAMIQYFEEYIEKEDAEEMMQLVSAYLGVEVSKEPDGLALRTSTGARRYTKKALANLYKFRDKLISYHTPENPE